MCIQKKYYKIIYLNTFCNISYKKIFDKKV